MNDKASQTTKLPDEWQHTDTYPTAEQLGYETDGDFQVVLHGNNTATATDGQRCITITDAEESVCLRTETYR